MESDPLGLDDGPNTYAYVAGNPLTYFDSNGLSKSTRHGQLSSPMQPLINLRVNGLINNIQRNYDPNFVYRTVRPLTSRYNNSDVVALQNALGQYQRYGQCPAPGYSPAGRSGNPINAVAGPANLPISINGTFFTQHAVQRMQGRGIPPSAVLDAVNNGLSLPGNRPGTTYHVGNGVNAVTNTSTGNVITVIPGVSF